MGILFLPPHPRTTTLSSISAVNRLSQVNCNMLLDEFANVSKTEQALNFLLSSKALGSAVIPVEIYKELGKLMIGNITGLSHVIFSMISFPNFAVSQ